MGGFALRIDSNRKLLSNVVNIATNGLPLDYLEGWTQRVEALTVADIRAAMARKLQPARMVTVVLGPSHEPPPDPAQAAAALRAPRAAAPAVAARPEKRQPPARRGRYASSVGNGNAHAIARGAAARPAPTPDRVRETCSTGSVRTWRAGAAWTPCRHRCAGPGSGLARRRQRAAGGTGGGPGRAPEPVVPAPAGQHRAGAPGDGVAALQHSAPASLDLVLLDPPFESLHYTAALKAAVRALAPQGFVYLEAPTAWDDGRWRAAGLALHRHLRAGAVHAHLLRRA